MPVIDHLLGNQTLRKAVWRIWYPFLTRRTAEEDLVFLNYAFETDPPMGIPLASGDERDRHCIQLYHHTAAQADLAGREVLEVSCGHGGGASYLTRTFHPRRYTGLDLNPAGIAFCRSRHAVAGLDFVTGDACALPFAANSFDVVINVEASHCYPDLPEFLSEVKRVLRPGGRFLYADFRFAQSIPAWEEAIAGCGLRVDRDENIGAEVMRGMEANSERSRSLLERSLPKWLHQLGRDFAGVKGSRIHHALHNGDMTYRCLGFTKPGGADGSPGQAAGLPPTAS